MNNRISPKLTRGMLITFPSISNLSPIPRVVVFQFNPTELSRSINPNAKQYGNESNMRIAGPPKETISFKAVFDATDPLIEGDSTAENFGVYTQLSSLELMVYPSILKVAADNILAFSGFIEIAPGEPPLTVFVWGIKRVLPVRLSSLSITEQAFDTDLNPIRAEVNLGLEVVPYTSGNLITSPSGLIFAAHHAIKEAMGVLNIADILF